MSSFASTFGRERLAIMPLLASAPGAEPLPPGLAARDDGAYCLSESGSARTRSATSARERQPDGSFLLSGEKMSITNGGFAVLIVLPR